MSATLKTPNYDFPIYSANDTTSWLTDFNNAMTGIDSNLKNVNTTADNADAKADANNTAIGNLQDTTQTQAEQINGLTSRTTTLETSTASNTNDINDIEGNLTNLTSEVNTLSDSVNGINTNISAIEDNIRTINTNIMALSNRDEAIIIQTNCTLDNLETVIEYETGNTGVYLGTFSLPDSVKPITASQVVGVNIRNLMKQYRSLGSTYTDSGTIKALLVGNGEKPTIGLHTACVIGIIAPK